MIVNKPCREPDFTFTVSLKGYSELTNKYLVWMKEGIFSLEESSTAMLIREINDQHLQWRFSNNMSLSWSSFDSSIWGNAPQKAYEGWKAFEIILK